MTNKTILIGVTIFALGIIILPETLALFAGQHTWYAVNQSSKTGDYGIPCAKCHIDVQQQIDSVQNGAHKNIECESCHIISQIAKNDTVGGTGSIHAAASPACLDCHDGSMKPGAALDPHSSVFSDLFPSNCIACHGTGINKHLNASSILYGANEAHIKFVQDAGNSSLLKSSNDACIGCHTHVAVDISWSKPTNISFNVQTNPAGGWIVNNFLAKGNKTINTTSGSY